MRTKIKRKVNDWSTRGKHGFDVDGDTNKTLQLAPGGSQSGPVTPLIAWTETRYSWIM